MGTKREMRDYRKLEDIIRILRPLIEKHQASQEDEYKSIYTKQMQEQHEMRLMHQKRQEMGGEFMLSSKKRSHPEDDQGVGGLENDIKKRDEKSEDLE
jgi:hypothetical protein